MGCPRNRDRTFDLVKVVAWREARAEEKLKEMKSKEDDDHSKRLREIKADTAAFQVGIMKGEYVALAEMKELLGQAAALQRNAQAIMRKRHGNGAGDLWEETLVEMEALMVRFLEDRIAEVLI